MGSTHETPLIITHRNGALGQGPPKQCITMKSEFQRARRLPRHTPDVTDRSRIGMGVSPELKKPAPNLPRF